MTNDDLDDKKTAGVKARLCGVCRLGCGAINFIRRHFLAAAAGVSLLLVAASVALWVFNKFEPIDLQDFVVALSAAFGLPLFVWRTTIHDKQADAAQKQAVIADRLRLDDAYDRAARRFVESDLATRLSGLHGLWELAREYPGIYHVQIMGLLCAFIRNPHTLENWEGEQGGAFVIRPDIEVAISFIRERGLAQVKYEKEKNYHLNLQGANLKYADFRAAELTNAQFRGAKLEDAKFICADLQSADLCDTTLDYTAFHLADLRSAIIMPSYGQKNETIAFFEDAAVDKNTRISTEAFKVVHLEEAVVLINEKGEESSGSPPSPKFRRISICEWEAKREEWRRKHLPPAIRR